MSLFDEPPLHDFPDRAIRKLLENPHNLRDLLEAVVPDLVDRFDFDRVEIVPRAFLMDDWRRRESDMLFRLPWLEEIIGEDAPHILVCVLIEHQSEPDLRMPLRVLLYAVLYWEQEWKTWEADHARGEPLRLTPIVPVVFHTGSQVWRAPRKLAELIGGPKELRAFVPDWGPVFWDLAERTPRELLDAAGEWLKALAVVRAEREDAEAFQSVFSEVLRQLEALSEPEQVRWHDLPHFVLSWALRRRPAQEREALWTAATMSQADVKHGEEVRRMSEVIERTWEQEVFARGETYGEVRQCREDLRIVLEARFGPLPQALAQQLEATTDLDRLRAALKTAVQVEKLSDLKL
jgi:hypothetical protein